MKKHKIPFYYIRIDLCKFLSKKNATATVGVRFEGRRIKYYNKNFALLHKNDFFMRENCVFENQYLLKYVSG